MNFVNYILDQSADAPDGSITLFRISAADLLVKSDTSDFAIIYRSVKNFSLHVVIDDSLTNEDNFRQFFERIFLVLGRENYNTILKKKQIFISFPKDLTSITSRVIFKLRSFSPNIFVINIRILADGRFASTANVCFEENELKRMSHFRIYLAGLVRENTMFEYSQNYFMITHERVDIARFNQLVLAELRAIPDLIMVLNKTSGELANFRETIDAGRDEKVSLLNAVSFLKKEVKSQYDDKEGIHRRAEDEANRNREKFDRYVDSIRSRYREQYDSLPLLYKKFGVVLKILSGKRELAYYLSRKQKAGFLLMLQSLPRDKQVELWYYYEYEILPAWYKKIASIIVKKKSSPK